MPKEINLLPRKNIGFLQQEQTIMVARAIAIFSVVIVVSSLIGLFFLQKNYSLSAIQGQQESVQAKIDLLHDKAVSHLTLLDRITKIDAILKKRVSLVDTISQLQKQVPSDVAIQSFTVSQTDMSMSVTSPSLVSVQKFIDSLSSLVAKKTLLQKLTIDNVLINQQTGLYSVSVKGTLL